MPKKIQKTLHDYISKIKTYHHPQIQLPFHSLPFSKSWILSGCKHPKTPSFALEGRNETHDGSNSSNNNDHKDDAAATLADVDRFLLENFKSLYLKDDDGDEENGSRYKNTRRVFLENQSHGEEGPKLGPMLFDPPRLLEMPRDLCGSTRFFVKPGFSGSLVVDDAMTSMTTTPRKISDRDETGSTATSTTTAITVNDSSSSKEGVNMEKTTLPDNCIALLSCSPNPYEEFKRSMKEMVETRARNHEGEIDWEFMEDLLFCYLNLNEKRSHKFILSAFVDIISVMRQNSEAGAMIKVKPHSVRTVMISRKVKK
ncbi:unnamed protein product [Lupinus luteus]|uniref:Transcription repressor n=1 Tax=Lupinus luteus TaxID=3873 RepID=A0AAV1XRH1_LUPLU